MDNSRFALHDSWWGIKIPVWAVLHVGAVFLPASFYIDGYGYVAFAGAVVFLLIQILLLIDIAYAMYQSWLENMKPLILALSIFCYVVAIGFVALEFTWFSGAGCARNNFFVAFNLLLCAGFTVLSLIKPVQEKVSVGILPPAIISVFNCWTIMSALIGQTDCNQFPASSQDSTPGWINVVTVLGTILVGAWMCLRSSGQGAVFSLTTPQGGETKADSAGDDGNALYNLSFFHLIFLLANMYVAMQLTNWGESFTDNIDNSNASMW
eukprot:CAMPEP_0114549446 /NCGR_PEP_ID=MMETSP0114-20121206/5530_1 /TAXON_ID=31324 /ORGANISM="Goniomonas sp, Strain m" /LENGTH=265 /DNA_ID=CAMNT_0001734125 /DNA_START=263 /DNA_END=1057 /DNA_ORIENTATION=-